MDRTLEGRWRVERVGGLLPPMVGVGKRIRGGRGVTRAGPFVAWPFRVEEREGHVALVYLPPFSAVVDEVWIEEGDVWGGRSTFGGREVGRFRMARIGYGERAPDRKETRMSQEKLRAKLVDYLENVHAMEQNVLLQLDSLILNTKDRELSEMFRAHKEETKRQERRVRERLRALGGPRLSSAGKDLAAISTAQVKGIADTFRSDKAARNARDAFVTEHLEIAAYELLERLANRAGDAETAGVARENRAEEEAMAARISENWDRFLDLTLAQEGIRP